MRDYYKQRNTMNAVLTSMEEGVIILNDKSEITFANKAAEHIFMGRTGVLRGRNFAHLTDFGKINEMIGDVLKNGKEVFVETVLKPHNQIYRVHVAPVKGINKHIEGAVAVFHDVTDARNFDQMRSEFVGNVSHELRTPLTSIKGFVETLLDGAMENGVLCRRFLTIIDNETYRLSRLIEDLLTLSAIESKEHAIKTEPMCIPQRIINVMHILGPQISEKSLRVDFIYQRNLPYIHADEDLINQVFINLLDNAIKYTPRHGQITIRSREANNRLVTTVTDTGVGIPQESLSRVFERFYRVDKARSRSQGGTGLGLAIVKHIVESHGGEVMVESEVGKGSTFGVSFITL
ncbi:MAG: ATP-binding protein [Syntrophomonadaceae bacterium]|nr:ATP-binding protein [Syntrophomonadaceae bacterium]